MLVNTQLWLVILGIKPRVDIYISEFDADDDVNISSSFSSKLQLLER